MAFTFEFDIHPFLVLEPLGFSIEDWDFFWVILDPNLITSYCRF